MVLESIILKIHTPTAFCHGPLRVQFVSYEHVGCSPRNETDATQCTTGAVIIRRSSNSTRYPSSHFHILGLTTKPVVTMLTQESKTPLLVNAQQYVGYVVLGVAVCPTIHQSRGKAGRWANHLSLEKHQLVTPTNSHNDYWPYARTGLDRDQGYQAKSTKSCKTAFLRALWCLKPV